MKIAIVGAGSAGVASAHALSRDGHRVTVYEKSHAVATQDSFGHAGWMAPALLHPWTVPGLAAEAAAHAAALPGSPALLRQTDAAWGAGSVGKLRWMWRWRKARRKLRSRPDDANPALLALERLAAHAPPLVEGLERQWELELERVQSCLVLLRGEADAVALRPVLDALEQAGTRHEWLDAEGARRIEPNLSEELEEALSFSRALYFPDGAAVNGRLLSQLQAQAAQAAGARFATGLAVDKLSPAPGENQRARLVLPGQDENAINPHAYDAIVLCAGAQAPALLKPLGLQLPLTPLHGYSINAPLKDATRAPRCAVLHWGEQVTLLRMGPRLRASAGAELGRKGGMHEPTLQRMHHCIHALFPGAATLHDATVQHWHGSRACTLDGLPLVGASGLPGIWLNLGHGSCGAAVSQGCARVLADLIEGRSPSMDAALLDPRRFG